MRRYWPAIFAGVALLVFATYIVYTQYLVRQIRYESKVHSEVYALVQQGLASPDDEQALLALWQAQGALQSLGVPVIVVGADGQPIAAHNLPFEPDLASEADRGRTLTYAERLRRRHPQNRVVVADYGTFYFGEPPLLGWLSWIPWLQVTVGMVLVIVALAIIRAEMRAERERLWAAMARELAHQMGTPLSSLAGWIEVLGLPAHEREQMADAGHIAHVISSDVERLENVSRRFELIGQPPRLEPVDVRDVIDELHAYFEPRLPRIGKGIRLRSRVARSVPPVQANRVLFTWAIENIVKNAIDALGGRDGTITVLAHTKGGMIHIHIMDDGPGIDPVVKDAIFDTGVTTKERGWGVGLALTRRIIERLHGGRVAARNRASRGAVFDITLPASGAATSRRRWLAR